MPNDTGKLYLYEALELRGAYDRQIRLLDRLLKPEESGRHVLYADRATADLRPAEGFDVEETEARLKRLKVKRLKLNEAIQVANFGAGIEFDGERVSLAHALELRKALREDLEGMAERVREAAYIRIIHKEERDIEKTPPVSFARASTEHDEALARLRTLVTALHRANHDVTVAFRDE